MLTSFFIIVIMIFDGLILCACIDYFKKFAKADSDFALCEVCFTFGLIGLGLLTVLLVWSMQ